MPRGVVGGFAAFWPVGVRGVSCAAVRAAVRAVLWIGVLEAWRGGHLRAWTPLAGRACAATDVALSSRRHAAAGANTAGRGHSDWFDTICSACSLGARGRATRPGESSAPRWCAAARRACGRGGGLGAVECRGGEDAVAARMGRYCRQHGRLHALGSCALSGRFDPQSLGGLGVVPGGGGDARVAHGVVRQGHRQGSATPPMAADRGRRGIAEEGHRISRSGASVLRDGRADRELPNRGVPVCASPRGRVLIDREWYLPRAGREVGNGAGRWGSVTRSGSRSSRCSPGG